MEKLDVFSLQRKLEHVQRRILELKREEARLVRLLKQQQKRVRVA